MDCGLSGYSFGQPFFSLRTKNLNQNRCSIQSLRGNNSVFVSIKKSPFFKTTLGYTSKYGAFSILSGL